MNAEIKTKLIERLQEDNDIAFVDDATGLTCYHYGVLRKPTIESADMYVDLFERGIGGLIQSGRFTHAACLEVNDTNSDSDSSDALCTTVYLGKRNV